MLDGLARLLDLSEGALAGAVLVFARVGAIMALLPGFGEQAIPARIRLGLALAFTMVVWPLLAPGLIALDPERPFYLMLLIEAGIGVLIGLSLRLMVMALQLAGSIAAQSTSLAQLFGGGVTPDPLPAIGNLLTLGGLTLAVSAGLHVKAALAVAETYEILPIGAAVSGADVARWGVARVAHAFGLGFSLAAPFVIAAFAYNLALGAINRAMPQLMVAFIGAPAITAGAMLLLMLAAPVILSTWNGQLDRLLANVLGMPR
jgi:flagellar biosynthesis protein FliR